MKLSALGATLLHFLLTFDICFQVVECLCLSFHLVFSSAATSRRPGQAESPLTAANQPLRFPHQLDVAQAALRSRSPGPDALRSSITSLRTSLEIRSSSMYSTMSSWQQSEAAEGLQPVRYDYITGSTTAAAGASAVVAGGSSHAHGGGSASGIGGASTSSSGEGPTGGQVVVAGVVTGAWLAGQADGGTRCTFSDAGDKGLPDKQLSAGREGGGSRLSKQSSSSIRAVRPGVAPAQPEQQEVIQLERERHERQQPRFSSTTLEDLSLTLGVVNLHLVTLVFDHTYLGDEAVAVLCPGLHRCSSLKQLSLVGCGLGLKSATALAQALVAGSYTGSGSTVAVATAAGHQGLLSDGWLRSTSFKASKQQQQQDEVTTGGSACSGRERSSSNSTSSTSSKGPPHLHVLRLSGNALAAIGLQHLLPALKAACDLQVKGGQVLNVGAGRVAKVQ